MSRLPELSSDDNRYGYVPSLAAGIVFFVLYSLSTGAHIFQAIKWRTWFMFSTAVLCGVLEMVGWGGRIWAHYNPTGVPPFQMQIVATIVGPTPLLAANFIVFGRIIRHLGGAYSRLTPRWYTLIFCTCDVISLIVQAVGGAQAAQGETLEEANRGGRIMLGGIVFQLSILIIYCILAIEYCARNLRDRPVRLLAMKQSADFLTRGEMTKNIQLMLAALALNSTCLFIRAVYRTIELSDGWTGRIIRTQVYFIVLDGVMVTLALYTFNFAHSGQLLAANSNKMLDSETSLPTESAQAEKRDRVGRAV
ncbi:RTA1 like protein-domain-containing protein [Coprinopsis sp. MPI-PUGE-AT-0042]|nr:RTA1 like protein-domain-containing protein [Coprinopsis sp. MPI-PUGE-AT-0042]